ncbi:hypothetical protein DBR44_03275 [Aquitalea sp. FJL05]|uniref:acyl-CoA thioester hydrolase/BAAT C-terminal domain-containing protein n=1 Tax=Aquitalea TaxID=407217 RepID=UPI000F5B872D|nr:MULTISPECIES: acyl-CoA thioester hydrolase/BAAT C-terminal domain-containing protein [Aquitalea]RQO77229.1 hypothetical protein DBR44_03275 [Aquitalea sp. FJL05]
MLTKCIYLLQALLLVLLLGCQSLPPLSEQAPTGKLFHYPDGGSAIYYEIAFGDIKKDTAIFTYAATGCSSLKYQLPQYFSAIKANATLYALNKRYVNDLSFINSCGDDFIRANIFKNRQQDFINFVKAKSAELSFKPKNIVLIGVSEAANVIIKAATQLPSVTHIVIIGSGGFTMRRSLQELKNNHLLNKIYDIDQASKMIKNESASLQRNWFGNPIHWWNDILDVDPIEDYLTISVPILLGVGAEDANQPLASVKYLEQKFTEHNKHNLTVRIYSNNGHSLSPTARADLFQLLNQYLVNN